MALSALIFGLLAATLQTHAQVQEHIDRGNRFYELGLYDEAGREYAAAASIAEDLPVVTYNLGNVYHQKMLERQAGKAPATATHSSQELSDRAVAAYKHAAGSNQPSLSEQAFFNMGNTYAKTGRLDEAILAYREALRLMPDDPDAKYNLEIVLGQKKKLKKDPPGSLPLKIPPMKTEKKRGFGEGQSASGGGGGGGAAGSGVASAGSPGNTENTNPGATKTPEAGAGSAPGQAQQDSSGKNQAAATEKAQAASTEKTAVDPLKATETALDRQQSKSADQSAERQQATQSSMNSQLNTRSIQLLEKANQLEQRSIDGWMRPPDFKPHKEQDW